MKVGDRKFTLGPTYLSSTVQHLRKATELTMCGTREVTRGRDRHARTRDKSRGSGHGHTTGHTGDAGGGHAAGAHAGRNQRYETWVQREQVDQAGGGVAQAGPGDVGEADMARRAGVKLGATGGDCDGEAVAENALGAVWGSRRGLTVRASQAVSCARARGCLRAGAWRTWCLLDWGLCRGLGEGGAGAGGREEV